MSAPRLVATDLDGTVVRSDGTISRRTVAAFQRVEAGGAVLVLVSGRPPWSLQEMAAATRHRGLAICANGAVLYDLHTEHVVQTHLIEPAVLAKIIAELRRELPGVTFAVDYEDSFAYEPAFLPEGWWRFRDGQRIRPDVDGAALASRPAAKLLARHTALDADTLLTKTTAAVGTLVTPTHSSNHGVVEISAYGVTKASALARLCHDYQIPAADVVAFGDMPNDLPMLAWAGTSYAVSNAHPKVLAAVDHIVGRNDEDGVAEVLERLFP